MKLNVSMEEIEASVANSVSTWQKQREFAKALPYIVDGDPMDVVRTHAPIPPDLAKLSLQDYIIHNLRKDLTQSKAG